MEIWEQICFIFILSKKKKTKIGVISFFLNNILISLFFSDYRYCIFMTIIVLKTALILFLANIYVYLFAIGADGLVRMIFSCNRQYSPLIVKLVLNLEYFFKMPKHWFRKCSSIVLDVFV